MKRISKNYKLFAILMIFWILIDLNLKPLNLIAGLIVCFFVTKLSYGILYNDKSFKFKSLKLTTLFKYFFNLMLEIYKSSFSYMFRIIKKDCEPFITEVELEVDDPLIITIISNSITLTPGTITVDVDKNKLTVLTLKICQNCDETVGKEIKEKFQKYFIK